MYNGDLATFHDIDEIKFFKRQSTKYADLWLGYEWNDSDELGGTFMFISLFDLITHYIFSNVISILEKWQPVDDSRLEDLIPNQENRWNDVGAGNCAKLSISSNSSLRRVNCLQASQFICQKQRHGNVLSLFFC